MAKENEDILKLLDVNNFENKELFDYVFAEMSKIEGVLDMLRMFQSQKVKQHFNASTPAEQLLTKGSFHCARWMEQNILKQRGKKNDAKSDTFIGNKRYAS